MKNLLYIIIAIFSSFSYQLQTNKQKLKYAIIAIFLTIFTSLSLSANQVNYTFTLSEKNEEVAGKMFKRIYINNSIPGPTIKANQGDILNITIVNKTSIDTSMHWHGVLVPNDQDGVIGATQPAIKPKETYTYSFKVKQTGTYWYHAHGLEEAQGVFGGIVFNDSKKKIEEGEVLLYSGKAFTDPEKILSLLQNSGNHNEASNSSNMVDSNNHHKESSSSNMGDSGNHHKSSSSSNMGNKNNNHMMTGTHFSDITFPVHTINSSQGVLKLSNTKNKTKLRIINTYVDGFLNFIYSGGDITIVATDGLDVKPVKVKNLRVAMGETYDIIIDTPKGNSYELVSFMLGTDDYSKVILGKGKLIPLQTYNFKDYKIDNPYNMLTTVTPTFINTSEFNNIANFNLTVSGGHRDYNWGIYEHKKQIEKLNLKVGDKVIVKITNHSMMPHPMHLHGFFFKVKNAKNNLYKHTYDLQHMEQIEIEFIVDEEGKWLFHCHNLFHMAQGLMITLDVKK